MYDVIALVNRAFEANNIWFLELMLSPHANFDKEYNRHVLRKLDVLKKLHLAEVRLEMFGELKRSGTTQLKQAKKRIRKAIYSDVLDGVGKSKVFFINGKERPLVNENDRWDFINFHMLEIDAVITRLEKKFLQAELNRRERMAIDVLQYDAEHTTLLEEFVQVQDSFRPIEEKVVKCVPQRKILFYELYEGKLMDDVLNELVEHYRLEFSSGAGGSSQDGSSAKGEKTYIDGKIDSLIDFLAEEFFSIDTKLNENGHTLLCKALLEGNAYLIELLLIRGASLTTQIREEDVTYPLYQLTLPCGRNLFVYAIENGMTLLALKLLSLQIQTRTQEQEVLARALYRRGSSADFERDLKDCVDNEGNTLMHQVFFILGNLSKQYEECKDYINNLALSSGAISPESDSKNGSSSHSRENKQFDIMYNILSCFRLDLLLEALMINICYVAIDYTRFLDLDYLNEKVNVSNKKIGHVLLDFENSHANEGSFFAGIFGALKSKIYADIRRDTICQVQGARKLGNAHEAAYREYVREGQIEDGNANVLPLSQSEDVHNSLIALWDHRGGNKLTPFHCVAVESMLRECGINKDGLPGSLEPTWLDRMLSRFKVIEDVEKTREAIRIYVQDGLLNKVAESRLLGSETPLLEFMKLEIDDEGRIISCIPREICEKGFAKKSMRRLDRSLARSGNSLPNIYKREKQFYGGVFHNLKMAEEERNEAHEQVQQQAQEIQALMEENECLRRGMEEQKEGERREDSGAQPIEEDEMVEESLDAQSTGKNEPVAEVFSSPLPEGEAVPVPKAGGSQAISREDVIISMSDYFINSLLEQGLSQQDMQSIFDGVQQKLSGQPVDPDGRRLQTSSDLSPASFAEYPSDSPLHQGSRIVANFSRTDDEHSGSDDDELQFSIETEAMSSP